LILQRYLNAETAENAEIDFFALLKTCFYFSSPIKGEEVVFNNKKTSFVHPMSAALCALCVLCV